MNIILTIKELVFKNGKCYGIIQEESGMRRGFVLNGKIFASMKINKTPTNSLFNCFKEMTETDITLHTYGDENGYLYTLYDLDKVFMDKMEGK